MKDERKLSVQALDDLGRLTLELRRIARSLTQDYPRDEACRVLARRAYLAADNVADTRSEVMVLFNSYETYRRQRQNVIPFKPRRRR